MTSFQTISLERFGLPGQTMAIKTINGQLSISSRNKIRVLKRQFREDLARLQGQKTSGDSSPPSLK